MRLSKVVILTFILLCCGTSSGCLLQNANIQGLAFPNFTNTTDSVVKDERNFIPKIVESLKTASKEDCLHHAKIYYGLAEFLKTSKAVKSTTDLAPPLGIVKSIQQDYNWDIGKNKEFTDLIAKDMDEYLKLKTPKEIDDDKNNAYRLQLIETFTVYGEGCLKAASLK